MFKALLSITCICFITLPAAAQQKITLQEVNKHIGDSVTVCGKIFGGKFLNTAKNQPTFLNVGAAYPEQLLTIVIWAETRKLLSYNPEEYLKGREVCVTGKIELFKEKPQIVVQQISSLIVQ